MQYNNPSRSRLGRLRITAIHAFRPPAHTTKPAAISFPAITRPQVVKSSPAQSVGVVKAPARSMRLPQDTRASRPTTTRRSHSPSSTCSPARSGVRSQLNTAPLPRTPGAPLLAANFAWHRKVRVGEKDSTEGSVHKRYFRSQQPARETKGPSPMSCHALSRPMIALCPSVRACCLAPCSGYRMTCSPIYSRRHSIVACAVR